LKTGPNKPARKTWEHPWRYRESFMVVLELVFMGLILEVLSGGRGAPLLRWPVNLGVGVGLTGLPGVIYFRFKNHPLVKWLSSIPAAISAISFFAFTVLLLGFIPQGDPAANRYLSLLGLTHMKNSWLMMVSGLYFLTVLGFVAWRRSRPLSRKNLGFLLNHAGLWITIAAGYLGAGDLVRLNLALREGQVATDQALNTRTRQAYTLPFAVRLVDFDIREYPPKMAVVDGRSGQVILEEGTSLPMIEKGLQTRMMDWDIEVLEYEPGAYWAEGAYVPADSVGSAPAAYVRASSRLTGKEQAGWISCGSYRVRQQFLTLDHHRLLAMTFPEAERYSSEIVVTDREAAGEGGRKSQSAILEVNRPFTHKGWKLYQLSYDERMGKWSSLSVIEAVRDPWLPVVYAGIFLLLGGALYLFWIGREMKE
jgi:hypothetical protein